MLSLIKRIIALLFVFVTLFLSVPFAFASSTSAKDVVSLADYLGFDTGVSLGDYYRTKWNSVGKGGFDGCPNSDNGKHFFSNTLTLEELLLGRKMASCLYCKASFEDVLAEQIGVPSADISDDDIPYIVDSLFTSALPATAYASDGSMRWYCSFDDLQNPKQLSVYPWRYYLGTRPFNWNAPFDSIEQNGLMYSRGTDNRSICVSYSGSSNVTFVGPRLTAYSFVVPISGTYTLMDFPASSCTVIGDSCGTVSGGYPYSNVGQSWHKNAGDSLSQSYQVAEPFNENLMVDYISGKVLFPVYSVIPDVIPGEPTVTEQYYDNSTRIGNYVGSYAVYNSTDNSYNPVSGDTHIVNETDNSVYNPVTNTTTDYSGWTYDYSTRTYTFSNDDNSNTSTVTYGDENITIADTAIDGNGNTVTNNYTVYYYNGTATDTPSPSPSPSPSDGPVVPGPSPSPSCRHDWTYTVVNEPTCLSAGSKTGACSLCGATKKETIPATGHTWVIKKSLATAYDDEGNLVQQGYTIYKCSICGEEYKDVDGVGPPGSSSEDEGGGFWAWVGDKLGGLLSAVLDLLGGLVGGLIDGLVSLLEMLLGKLGTVVEAILSVFAVLPSLFTGFLDLLSALFPFLPEEIMTVLTFGIIACVVIGIIRLIWR